VAADPSDASRSPLATPAGRLRVLRQSVLLAILIVATARYWRGAPDPEPIRPKPLLAAKPDRIPPSIDRIAQWLASQLTRRDAAAWPTVIPQLMQHAPPDSLRPDLTAWAVAVVALKPGRVRFHAVPRDGTPSLFRFCDLMARGGPLMPAGRFDVFCLGNGRVGADGGRPLGDGATLSPLGPPRP
jgi:hypothetical protein